MDARLTVKDGSEIVVAHGVHQLRVPDGTLETEKGGTAFINTANKHWEILLDGNGNIVFNDNEIVYVWSDRP